MQCALRDEEKNELDRDERISYANNYLPNSDKLKCIRR